MRAGLKRAQENGYVITPDGKAVEHRAIYEQHHGKIPRDWVVHHINERKQDNFIENLIALPQRLHTALHAVQSAAAVRFTREQILEFLKEIQAEEHRINKEILVQEDRLRQTIARRDAVGEEILKAKVSMGLVRSRLDFIDTDRKKTPFQAKTVLRKNRDE
jgi:hypothetical protein